MTVSLIVDLLIASLLVATIGYAWVLNRKLGALRADRAALDQTALRFTEAASRAELAVADLKGASSTSGRVLEDTLKRATTLRDDLAYLIERAEAVAQRLETPRAAVAAAESTIAAPGKEPAARGARKPEPADKDAETAAQTLRELKQALASLR